MIDYYAHDHHGYNYDNYYCDYHNSCDYQCN